MVAGMLMPLRELRAIYELLFRDGVMVAKKDKRPQTKHPEIPAIANLQVIRVMGSLKSRGYVTETFAWRHFYWYLSNEGIIYLRDYLRLPAEIVPASLQRVKRSTATLAISRRAAHVQSIEGPTSYVPKPGSESREGLAERQDYRHKRADGGEEGFNDGTPRFRGRPAAAEPVRPRASWEAKDQHQHLYMKGRGFSKGDTVTGEDQVNKTSLSSQQNDSVSRNKPLITSQQSPVSEISVGKAHVVQAKTKDQTHTSPPVAVSEVVISKASLQYSVNETKKDKSKEELIQPSEIKYSVASTPLPKNVKEQKTMFENASPQQMKVTEVKAPVETAVVKEKPQKVTNKPEPQVGPKPPGDLQTSSKPAISTSTHLTREIKQEQSEAKVVWEPIAPATSAEWSITRTSKLTITQDKLKPVAEKTTNKPLLTTEPIKEGKMSTVEVAQKLKPVAEKTTNKPLLTAEPIKEEKMSTVEVAQKLKPVAEKTTNKPLLTAEPIKQEKMSTIEMAQKLKPVAEKISDKPLLMAKPIKEEKRSTVEVAQKRKPVAEKTTNKPVLTAEPVKEEKRSTVEVAQKLKPEAEKTTNKPLTVEPMKEEKWSTVKVAQKLKPEAEKTTNKPLTVEPMKEEKRSTVEVAPKLDEFPAKCLPVNVLPHKGNAEITVEPTTSVVETVSTTVVISSHMSTGLETIKSKETTMKKSVKEAEKPLKVADVPTPSEQQAELLKNECSTHQNNASIVVTENVSGDNIEVETSSKSKKKKKKTFREKATTMKNAESPDVKMTAEKASEIQASLDVTQNASGTPTLPPTVKLEGPSDDENKLQAKMSIDVTLNQDVPTPIVDQTVSKAVVYLPAVPPVEIPVTAEVKNKAAETNLGKIPKGPLCTEDGVTDTELTVITRKNHQETSQSETEIVTVTRMETVTVHKTVTIEQTVESTTPVEKATVVLSDSQKIIDGCEIKDPAAVSNSLEESSKGKKRGKAKKQAQARVSATITTEPAPPPPAADPLSSPDALSSPQAISPTTTASEQTGGSPTIPLERMCSEEIRQATAVLTEAPADKGEEEPARLSSEKFKREVPKPKTSSSVREAHTAGKLTSAEAAVAAEATGEKAQASPRVKPGEATKAVAQLHSAAQAGKPSAGGKVLSVHRASVKKDQQKDLQKDTPSVTTATPESTPPHPVDSCHSLRPETTDEANMRRKIVVVEEIIEVKHIASPHAGGQSPPTPVTPEGDDEEEEELDLDVLEELAIERALLNAAPPAAAYRTSSEEDWDHDLEQPEEKTWPHFIEGWFVSYLASYATSCCCPFVCPCDVMVATGLSTFLWSVGGLKVRCLFLAPQPPRT
ncbi:hypothetical protein NHX12_002011 [Muraenolepis orangiensis]|uniref:Plectin/eS10 N-terminal domain-containing protein n=1 Tax=Muraenolepis orangiensis TaxID=630683 RepID=A0A9Q0E0S5_9TELE|nr:hypothetical protein NHX12_002011 [Muraenolepis orangiensis]